MILTEETLDEFEKASLLYKGDLFGDRAYNWCIADRERYHEGYYEIVKQLACYNMKKKDNKKAMNLLKKFLLKSLYDVEIGELLDEVKTYAQYK